MSISPAFPELLGLLKHLEQVSIPECAQHKYTSLRAEAATVLEKGQIMLARYIDPTHFYSSEAVQSSPEHHWVHFSYKTASEYHLELSEYYRHFHSFFPESFTSRDNVQTDHFKRVFSGWSLSGRMVLSHSLVLFTIILIIFKHVRGDANNQHKEMIYFLLALTKSMS